MINTEAMPCSSILLRLVATEQRALETVAQPSGVKVGRLGLASLDWMLTQPSIITGIKINPSCTIG